MAKELPFFKFEPNQWENGNVQICSREDKGLFIDLCSMYWSRLGDLPLKLAIQKLCAGNATAFDSLMREEIFEVIDGLICINFLNEQLNEFNDLRQQNSKNAKEGWEKRRKLKDASERNATASIPQCENDAIREEKRIEDKRRNILSLTLESDFIKFWDLYNKKIDSKKCKDKFFKLSKSEVSIILNVVKIYVDSTPDPKFRKNPLTWLNGKCWEDVEITELSPTPEKPFGKTNQI